MYVFENEGHTNIMFPFEDVELDVGKLAMWRLQTHEQFGGTWLSDYVPNRLGGFIEEQPAQEQKKPDCPLIGTDSNIFSLMGIASKTLKRYGMAEQAKEMCERITSSGDYNKALCIIGEYVNITSVDDDDMDESEDEETYVNISGGTLTIINDTGNDADGIDSNGDIYISGGTVLISLTNSGSNNAIDYGSESGGECIITGGTIIAAGSSAMAESFSSSSTQASIMYTYSTGADSNTLVTVADSDGNTILSWEVPNSFSLISLSCPEMTVGSTYTLTIGDTEDSITLEDVNTSTSDSGSSEMTGSMGMEMGQGGGRGQMGQKDHMGQKPMQNDSSSDSEDQEMSPPEDMDDSGQMSPPGDMEGSGQMGGPGDMNESEGEITEEVSNLTALSDLDSDVWLLLIASAVVLIGGLTFVYFYKKK